MENKQLEVEARYEAKSIQEAFRIAEDLETEHRRSSIEFENEFGENNPFFELVSQIAAETEANGQSIEMHELFNLVKKRTLELDIDKKDKIIAYIEKISELNNASDKLEAKWREPAEQQLLKKKDEIVKKTDWDSLTSAILKQLDSNISMTDQNEFCFLTRDLINPRLGSLLEINNYIKSADQLDAMLSKYDLEVRSAEPNNEQNWLTQGNIDGILKDWIEETKRTELYLAPHRRTWFIQHFQNFEAEAKELRRLINRFDIKPDTAVPSPIMDALENHAADMMLRLNKQSDAHFKELNERRANALFITNAELLTETTDILNAHEWINERLDRYPPEFVESIGFIEFAADENSHEHDDPSFTVGEHKKSENKLYIDTRRGTFLKYSGKYSEPVLGAFVRKEVQETLDHEIGHHVHNKVLNLEDLIEWEAILGADPAPMDEYMKDVRQEWLDTSSEEGAKLMRSRYGYETFATAFALYMQNPIKLAADFPPERFAYFNRRLKLYNNFDVTLNVGAVKSLVAKSPSSAKIYYDLSNEKIGARP